MYLLLYRQHLLSKYVFVIVQTTLAVLHTLLYLGITCNQIIVYTCSWCWCSIWYCCSICCCCCRGCMTWCSCSTTPVNNITIALHWVVTTSLVSLLKAARQTTAALILGCLYIVIFSFIPSFLPSFIFDDTMFSVAGYSRTLLLYLHLWYLKCY